MQTLKALQKKLHKPTLPRTKPAAPKLTLVPSRPTPYNRMLKKLSESGLDTAGVKLLRLEPCTAEESKALSLSRTGEGFKIPYYDLRGKLLPTFRYRYFDTVGEGFLAGAELRKYDQPAGSPVEIYLSRGTDWEAIAAHTDRPLIISEGELKSACATKNGYPTIGLGGVWSFGRGKGDLRLHKTLTTFKWTGRSVFICYDSDAAKKPEVMGAENRLARALLDAGAIVYVVRIPPDGPDKVGLDDFIVKNGKEKFEELLKSTPMWDTYRHLHELNAEYVVCRNVAAICEIATCTMFSAEKFLLREATRNYREMNAAGKMCELNAGKEWIKWPQRGEVEGLTYDPGAPRVVCGRLNQWSDPGIEPRQGDTKLFDELFAHLIPDAGQRKWILEWAAYPLQHRGGRNNAAITLWSRTQGQGKSLLGETFGWLHGKANYIEIGTEQIASDFNEWQPRRTFIMGSELCGPSTRDARTFTDKMKSLITASDININEKYEKTYTMPNRANYFLTSNHPTALHLTEEARRYFVVHATESRLPQEFYTRFLAWRENGGLSALLCKLLCVDLSGFNPGASAPRTPDMQDMVAAGRSDLQDWCHDLAENPEAALLRCKAHRSLVTARFATAWQLLDAYLACTSSARVSKPQMVQELTAAGLVRVNEGVQIRIRDDKDKDTGRRERLWVLRNKVGAKEKRSAPNKMTPDQIGKEWRETFKDYLPKYAAEDGQ